MKKNFGLILSLTAVVCIMIAVEYSSISPENVRYEIESHNENSIDEIPLPQNALNSPLLSAITPNYNINGVVHLNWTNIPNAAFYNIYRSTNNFSTYNMSILVGTTTQTSLTDWIELDGIYFYGVTAVNKSIGESSLSNIRNVTIHLLPIPSSKIELKYSRLIGGSGEDIINAIALDEIGNIYVTGYTGSSHIFISNAYDSSFGGQIDAFVAKFSPTGAKLWETYLGGSNIDFGFDIAVDNNNFVYVVGYTYSSDFPSINSDFYIFNGEQDAFITKFNSDGIIQWSTFYGGIGIDRAYGLTVDNESNVYITGVTTSSDLPMINSSSSELKSPYDLYIAKFNPSGTILWSNYFGNTVRHWGNKITVDQDGNCYIVGERHRVKQIIFDPNDPYNIDAIILKYNTTGGINWTKYIEGSVYKVLAKDIVLGLNNNIYITGYTTYPLFPTKNAYDNSHNGNFDGYVTCFYPNGTTVWSTFFGGSDGDGGYAIAVDSFGNIYVTGETYSTNFPTYDSYNNSLNGLSDLFLIKFDAIGQFISSTYIGSSGNEQGNAIAVNYNGNIFIAGGTNSNNFPVTNVDNSFYNGSWDAFVLCYPIIKPPSPPVLNAITPFESSTGEIVLNWSVVENATYYTLYRSKSYITTLNETVEIVGTWNTTTGYDEVPDIGDYYYIVRAGNASGFSNISNCEKVTVQNITVRPPTLHPFNSIYNLNQAIYISWNSSHRVSYYKVYRSTEEIISVNDAEYLGNTVNTGGYDIPPTVGKYYYAVTSVYSTYGESPISNTQLAIVNDIPELIVDDLNFTAGIPEKYLEIYIKDRVYNQTDLIIYLNGSVVEVRAWEPNNPIKFNVDHLQPGTYNATIMISDGYNGNVSKSVFIKVYPNFLPQLSVIGENFSLYFVGENFTLHWNGTDNNTYHPTYILFRNQTQIQTGSWDSGDNITIQLTEPTVGWYIYELQIFDGYGGVASSQIMIVISLPENDEDGDGMTNEYERRWGLNPFVDDSQEDPDEDRLTNYQEFLYGTNPFSKDTDGDELSDWDEVFIYGTNPTNPDTDNDGWDDYTEIRWRSNPLSKWSTPVTLLVGWIIFGLAMVITIPLGIHKYKTELKIFNKKFPQLIKNGYIFNLLTQLKDHKLLPFFFHTRKRLIERKFQNQAGTQNWYSNELWQEMKQIETQITQKDYLSAAVQMTKSSFELLVAFDIPAKFLHAIKATTGEEIAQLKFSSLNWDLQKIIKGFDQTAKKITSQNSTQPDPSNNSIITQQNQAFLDWRDTLIPLQQQLAYHIRIKEDIDHVINRYKGGEWVKSAEDLNKLQDKIEIADPPYSSSVKSYISQVIQKSTDFLKTIHQDQIQTLQTLQQQGQYFLAAYSWLKNTQFKHPNPEDPSWQNELTMIIEKWSETMGENISKADWEKISRDVQWIIHAFPAQNKALEKIEQLKKQMKINK